MRKAEPSQRQRGYHYKIVTCTSRSGCSRMPHRVWWRPRLGHSDTTITLQTYAHVLRPDAAGVGEVFAGCCPVIQSVRQIAQLRGSARGGGIRS